MVGVWRPEYGRAYRERKRLGIRSEYSNSLTFEERFAKGADRSGGLWACWPWLGYRIPTGYGRVTYEGRIVMAHRAAYEYLVGPIPEGLEVDHLCRNRACVNPAHLEPVTHAENSRRSVKPWGTRPACAAGHPYTAENLRLDAQGRRVCRACRREASRRHRSKGAVAA